VAHVVRKLFGKAIDEILSFHGVEIKIVDVLTGHPEIEEDEEISAFFMRKNRTIYITGVDTHAIAHELGHAIDAYQASFYDFSTRCDAPTLLLYERHRSIYGRTGEKNVIEWFAEGIRVWVGAHSYTYDEPKITREELLQRWPEVYAYLEGRLSMIQCS
jgi:hypothetical protein